MTCFPIQIRYSPEGKCMIYPSREVSSLADIRTWNLTSTVLARYLLSVHVGILVTLLVTAIIQTLQCC